jgi:aromatic-L-amino-acid/L-tryptophan decarboxylase
VRQPLCSICTFRLRLGCRFRKAGYQAIDRICDYYYSLQERPVTSQVEPGYLRKALPRQLSPFLEIRCLANYTYYSASAPDVGEDFQFVADDYQRLILPGGHSYHSILILFTSNHEVSPTGNIHRFLATSQPRAHSRVCLPTCTPAVSVILDSMSANE